MTPLVSYTHNETYPHRMIYMLGIMGLGILLLVGASRWAPGWHSASLWGYGLTAIYGLYYLLTRDAVVGRILGFALVAGFAELVADHYLVQYTHTLIYDQNQPMIWDSPAYMPFSWAVVLTEIGVIDWLLMQKRSPLVTGLLSIVLGACLIPLYEYLAIKADWWHYVLAPEWWGVPRYIYIAEGLLLFPVAFLIRRAIAVGWRGILIGGLLEGAVMLAACLIAYKIAG